MTGFDPSDNAAPYHLQTMRGGETTYLGYTYTEHSFLGATYNDGKADCLRKIQDALNDQDLFDKAEAWGRIYSHANDIASRLQSAYSTVFSNWSGDDADRAQKTFGYTVQSAGSVRDAAQGMQKGTTTLAKAAQHVKGTASSGPSGGAQFANAAIGFNIGGDGDGGNLQGAVDYLATQIGTSCSEMPPSVEWQTKTDAGGTNAYGGDPGATSAGAGAGSGVHGASAPHMGTTTPQHTSVGTSKITDPTRTGHNGPPPTIPPTDPPGTPPIGTDPLPPVHGGGGGIGGGGGPGPGGGLPGLDTGSSLAGIPGGGAGAGGLGAAGGGGLGSGGLAGGGLGADGLGGAGSLAGTGAGALGAGGAGAGVDGGAGAAGAGAGGRGAAGMVPMRPGGRGSEDDERERSTWLTEDDDVWAGEEAPPSVIS